MVRELRIANTVINDESAAYCIAELGSSGEADTELTKRFIDAAADTGAAAIKVQKRSNDARLYTKAMLDQPYLGPNSFGKTYGEHRAALEYSRQQLVELCQYTHDKGLHFAATPFDCASAEMLWEVGVDFLKIASACVTDTVLLDHCARLGLPIVLSTGTGAQHDVDLAVQTITQHGCPLAVLQCSATYPCLDPALLHLRVIETYRQRYPWIVTGLSSHFPQTTDVEAAYVLGGRVFEKHFTLDRRMRGADHSFSLEPQAFANMVNHLETLRIALGSPYKQRLPEEQAAITKMGKTLRAARMLPAGYVLTRDDIAIRSPGGEGPTPARLAEYIGRTLPEVLAEDEPLPEMRWYE